MVSNTRYILISFLVGAAHLAIASPAEPSVAVDDPEYRTAPASVAVDVPEYRTASATVAVDDPEYRTASATVAVDDPEYRTASATVAVDVPEYRTASNSVAVDIPESRTASASAPVSTDCPKKCSTAYDDCRGKPDANRSTCAAQYAECLGFNPFGADGSLITPTACSAASSTAVASTAKSTSTGTPPVIVSGAGRALPADILGAIGAFGVAALAFF